ncbi:MAG: FdhF/YdeP family oxidoreductase [Planctomycetes bacterium]|nr:FdhF/YdeP family oxidoreductase [Planctomycetota bacterium]
MTRRGRGFFERVHGLVPFGLFEEKPRHFREMLRIVWENRDSLGYAWRILNEGVCDGCALGTSGLRDWTVDGTHLCLVRLNLLRLNTMGAMEANALDDVARLRAKSSRELRELGRLAYPMRRRRGESGFTRVSFDEVWRDVGARWRGFDPARTAMFVTSRGITNEVYYTAQKVMRFLGSNHVDNSARLCHSPSTTGLKSTIGVAATTCSYRDWYEADVIVFLGSNPANDQPVAMKYLFEAKRRGARILAINAYREPGLERYWVPSTPESAVFGTNLADRFFLVKVGGDLAFLNAVAKVALANGWGKRDFVEQATVGFDAWKRELDAQSLDELCTLCGLPLEEIEACARALAEADRGVLVWSMGITQHAHGAETVKAIANLGLLFEYVGRPGTGLMPIRGHSGVQGGAEMGAYSTAFPGGVSIDAESAKHFGELWGFDVPSRPGMTTVDYLEASHRGELDALYAIGGNFLETMPEPERIAAGLAKIPLRIHSDIVVTNQMLVEPADVVYLLPARTRYEQKDGGTETSTERRVIFSPRVAGHDLRETRSEWEMLLEFAEAVKPGARAKLGLDGGAAIRADIARAVPIYRGIETLAKRGDQFQWGGPMLCTERRFPTADGKAHFQPVRPPLRRTRAGRFLLATRRGKQFNSMVQRDHDALTGADRDHVFISRADAARLAIAPNARIRLRNELGTFEGRAFFAPVADGTLQGHWPEVNGLIAHGVVDAGGGVPDYNAEVELEVLR